MMQENIPPIFCSACGQKNAGDANFCLKCGKQIVSTVATRPPPPVSATPVGPGPERAEQKSSGIVTALAVVGFVFGLIGMLGSFVPLIGIFAIRICIGAALISGLSVVIALAQNARRTFPIVALNISLIGVAMIYVQIGKLQSATESVRKFTEEMQTNQPIKKQQPRQQRQPNTTSSPGSKLSAGTSSSVTPPGIVAPFGFSIGISSLEDVRRGLPKEVTLTISGTNAVSQGPAAFAYGGIYEKEGISDVSFFFDQRNILSCVSMTLEGRHFQDIYDQAKKEIHVLEKPNYSIENLSAKFQSGDVIIEMRSARSYSSKVNFMYQSVDYNQRLKEYQKRRG